MENDEFYNDVKEKLMSLNKVKLINDKQLDYLLLLARQKLGLIVETKSIYL